MSQNFTAVPEAVEKVLQPMGFLLHGCTALKQTVSLEIYKSWLNENFHGEMAYLETHLPLKSDPKKWAPRAQSAIVVAHAYSPHPRPGLPLKQARVALYAQGEDYHFWLKEKLHKACLELKKIYPDEEFLPATDAVPLLERDLAYQAGLGWFGKNSCLINAKKGSLFVLGEILTSLSLTAELEPSADHCGTCRQCIDVCPTGALNEDRSLDARKCISYLTIESRQVPAEELRPKISDWLFGCDLCQTVCPWNQKIFRAQGFQALPVAGKTAQQRDELVADLEFLLTSSGKKIERAMMGTPLKRAGPFGLRRNALIVAANLRLQELLPSIQRWKEDPRLGELAGWAEAAILSLNPNPA